MKLEIKVDGLEKVSKNLQALALLYPKAAKGAVYLGLEEVMTDSKENYVPVDNSELKSSGHVRMDDTPGAIRGGLGFGGPAGIGENKEDVGYAIVQHEETAYDPHTVGESKYLEKPLMRRADSLLSGIARDIREEVGG